LPLYLEERVYLHLFPEDEANLYGRQEDAKNGKKRARSPSNKKRDMGSVDLDDIDFLRQKIRNLALDFKEHSGIFGTILGGCIVQSLTLTAHCDTVHCIHSVLCVLQHHHAVNPFHEITIGNPIPDPATEALARERNRRTSLHGMNPSLFFLTPEDLAEYALHQYCVGLSDEALDRGITRLTEEEEQKQHNKYDEDDENEKTKRFYLDRLHLRVVAAFLRSGKSVRFRRVRNAGARLYLSNLYLSIYLISYLTF
jgi:hypothetical protein